MSKQKVVLISEAKKELEKIRNDLKEDFGIVATIEEKAGKQLLSVDSLFEYQIAVVYIRVKKYQLHFSDIFVDKTGKKGYLAHSNIYFFAKYYIPKEYIKSEVAAELLEELKRYIKTETNYYPQYSVATLNSEECNLFGHFSLIFENFKKTLGKDATLQDAIVSFIINEVPRISNSVQNAVALFEESDKYKGKEEFFRVQNCLDFWGAKIQTKSQANKERLNMLYREYVSKKATIEVGSLYPEGWNLSPKEEIQSDEKDEYWRSESSYRKENVTFEDEEIKENEKGLVGKSNWVTFYRESAKPSKNTSSILEKEFRMQDTVNVTHRLKICSNSLLKVISYVEGERVVQGKKLCPTPTVYDALYQNKNYQNGKFNFTVTDYYEIISLNKLLHYTDASKFYEVIEIPLEFSFEDGLQGLKSRVFDDGDKEWICYQDISEVKAALLKEE